MTRLTRELQMIKKLNKNHQLYEVNLPTNAINHWYVSFICPKNTIYEGEKYTLQYKFNSNYPIEAPEVVFIGKAPEHEHVYSNGFICLNILYDGWTAALNVNTIT